MTKNGIMTQNGMYAPHLIAIPKTMMGANAMLMAVMYLVLAERFPPPVQKIP